MEVQKRVQLKTLDKPKEADANPVRLAVRFEIKLEESTDDKCPEISYTDLLLKHEMKRKRASMSSNSRMVSNNTRNVCISYKYGHQHTIYLFVDLAIILFFVLASDIIC